METRLSQPQIRANISSAVDKSMVVREKRKIVGEKQVEITEKSDKNDFIEYYILSNIYISFFSRSKNWARSRIIVKS